MREEVKAREEHAKRLSIEWLSIDRENWRSKASFIDNLNVRKIILQGRDLELWGLIYLVSFVALKDQTKAGLLDQWLMSHIHFHQHNKA